MPALGMTQDTGEILSWNFELGAVVKADDILFEVETDKTTVEVEAGSAGVIVEVMAAAGEAVPVGSVIAVIDSDESSAIVASTSRSSAAASVSDASESENANHERAAKKVATLSTVAPIESSNAVSASASQVTKAAAPRRTTAADPATGKNRLAQTSSSKKEGKPPLSLNASAPILASPKAKRAARDKGITLEQLVEAGIDQPLQYVDVQNYVPGANISGATQSLLQARVSHAAYKEFLEWTDKQTDTDTVSGLVWSLFATSAWRHCCAPDPLADVYVQLEQWSNRDADLFSINADRVGLLEIIAYEPNGVVDMLVRDMTGTPYCHYQSPRESASPSLTVVGDGAEHLSLSLRFNESSLSIDAAMLLLNRICQLVEQPLRHLL